MVSTADSNGQLLFIMPKDPSRSFYYSYDTTAADFTTFREILLEVMKSKQQVFYFRDAFGRDSKSGELAHLLDKPIEEIRCLQPFYIKLVAHDDKIAGMRILVRTLTGEIQALQAMSDTSIKRLKLAVYSRTLVSDDQLQLLFRGKWLQDGRTLADYDIQENSTLHLYYP